MSKILIVTNEQINVAFSPKMFQGHVTKTKKTATRSVDENTDSGLEVSAISTTSQTTISHLDILMQNSSSEDTFD